MHVNTTILPIDTNKSISSMAKEKKVSRSDVIDAINRIQKPGFPPKCTGKLILNEMLEFIESVKDDENLSYMMMTAMPHDLYLHTVDRYEIPEVYAYIQSKYGYVPRIIYYYCCLYIRAPSYNGNQSIGVINFFFLRFVSMLFTGKGSHGNENILYNELLRANSEKKELYGRANSDFRSDIFERKLIPYIREFTGEKELKPILDILGYDILSLKCYVCKNNILMGPEDSYIDQIVEQNGDIFDNKDNTFFISCMRSRHNRSYYICVRDKYYGQKDYKLTSDGLVELNSFYTSVEITFTMICMHTLHLGAGKDLGIIHILENLNREN